MELKGSVIHIGQPERKSDKFTVQTFVIETESKYPQFVEFQLTNDRVGLADKYMDKVVTVHFDVEGRKWQKDASQPVKYFNTLKCWQIVGSGESSHEKPTEKSMEQAGKPDPRNPHLYDNGEIQYHSHDDFPF